MHISPGAPILVAASLRTVDVISPPVSFSLRLSEHWTRNRCGDGYRSSVWVRCPDKKNPFFVTDKLRPASDDGLTARVFAQVENQSHA